MTNNHKTKVYYPETDSFKIRANEITNILSIALKISSKCQLNCDFCCNDEDFGTLSLDNAEILLNKFNNNGILRVCITGGEPLIQTNCMKIIESVQTKGIFPVVSTNGVQIPFNEIPTPGQISFRVSLHGLSNTHNQIVGKDVFNKVLNNIQRLVAKGHYVFTVSVINKRNYAEIGELMKILSEIGIRKAYLFNLLRKKKALETYFNKGLDVTQSELEKLKTDFDIVKEKYGEKFGVHLYRFDKPGSCIICFPDGDVFAEPFPNTNGYIHITNLFTSDNISLDIEMLKNHIEHLIWE